MRRFVLDDTAKAICCGIRLDTSIKPFHLPKSMITYDASEKLETFVLMPLWLAQRHKIAKFALKGVEKK